MRLAESHGGCYFSFIIIFIELLSRRGNRRLYGLGRCCMETEQKCGFISKQLKLW